MCMRAKSLQSRLTLCDPMDHSLPGFTIHGVSQAGILEWVAIFLLQLDPRDQAPLSLMSPSLTGELFLPLAPLGKPAYKILL